jgi:hypothetical protein
MTDNVSPVKNLLVTLVKPGGLEAIHILELQSPGIWRYYGLARTTEPFLPVPDASYVNRAVALYRHLIGVPTDRDSPLAP